MTTHKNGEVSWTDTVINTGKKSGGGKDMFLRLVPGSNIVRLLTAPFQYQQHRYQPEGGKKYGYRINCSKTATTSCPLCEQGDRPKTRFFLGVIDRKTDLYKILDIGPSVFQSIQTFARDEDWGTPDKYDLDIVVDPDGGATGYYRVVCKPQKPLSASDLVKREENDPEELVRRTTAPAFEKVAERLATIKAEIENEGGGSSSSASSNSSDDDEDDNYFKNYDTEKKAKSSF